MRSAWFHWRCCFKTIHLISLPPQIVRSLLCFYWHPAPACSWKRSPSSSCNRLFPRTFFHNPNRISEDSTLRFSTNKCGWSLFFSGQHPVCCIESPASTVPLSTLKMTPTTAADIEHLHTGSLLPDSFQSVAAKQVPLLCPVFQLSSS